MRTQTVTDTATDTVTSAVEHIADALLAWHDWLIGGPAVELRLADGLPTTGRFGCVMQSPDTDELFAAGTDLRQCAVRLQAVVDEMVDEVGVEPQRATGRRLADVLRALAGLLQEHAEHLRSLSSAGGISASESHQAQVLRAERMLHRKVLDTLRA